MLTILRFFSLRHITTHRVRSLLGMTAIALGIAIFVSSRIANTAVLKSLSQATIDLAGQAEWQVTRGRSLGVETEVLPLIRALPGAIAAPILQAQAALELGSEVVGSVAVLGVEFKNDSLMRLYQFEGPRLSPIELFSLLSNRGVFLSKTTATAMGLNAGDDLHIRTRLGSEIFRIVQLLEDKGPVKALGGHVVVMDLETAQKSFVRPGRADRIEVSGVSFETLQNRLPDHLVESVAKPGTLVEDALARLRSLYAVSIIAVLVGIFIVYNTVSISVLERVKEIGTLRALGARRSLLMRGLVVEWLLIGAVGSILGIGIGYVLARTLVKFTTGTMNTLMEVVRVDQVEFEPLAGLLGLVAGLLSTVLAAWWPTRRALKLPPIVILRAHSYRLESRPIVAFRVGLLLFAAGIALVFLFRRSFAGVASTAVIFTGVALILPELTVRAAMYTRPFFRRVFNIEGFLAADNVAKFPHRTALTVVTLGGAISMLVASAALIEGFRTATQRWMRDALPFDLAVSATNFNTSVYSNAAFSPGILEDVRAFPAAELVYGVRTAFTDFRRQDIMVLAVEMKNFLAVHAARGLTPWAENVRNADHDGAISSGEALIISENFAEIFSVKVGERLELETPAGRRTFEIRAIIEDYSWPHGLIAIDLKTYREVWKDDSLTYVDLRLRPGVSLEHAREDLRTHLSPHHMAHVFSADDIRKLAEETLDDTMALADIQVLIALIIGGLGIVNTLLIAVMQRTREIGLLRAVGMTRRRVGKTVIIEGLFIAVFGGVVGIVCGLAGGWGPLRLFALAMTGYWPPLVVPWQHVSGALVLASTIGVLASLVPARTAARTKVLEAIGYE